MYLTLEEQLQLFNLLFLLLSRVLYSTIKSHRLLPKLRSEWKFASRTKVD